MRNSPDEPLYYALNSEPCLDARRERMKVADALDFVVGKFHVEVIFETGKEFESLQTVDPELLVEIVARLKLGARNLEMSSRQIQDFVGSLFNCFHDPFYFTGSSSPLANGAAVAN